MDKSSLGASRFQTRALRWASALFLGFVAALALRPLKDFFVYRSHCEQGNASQCLELAHRLFRSGSLPKATRAYEKSCAMGSDEACFESISIAYTQGRVSLATTRDTLEAMCQRGRFEACQNLGIILTEEAGRKKNESFALQGYAFLERACEGHFARSCLDLGELDFHAKEGKKALAHYARACEFGDATACSKKKNLETNWKTLMCFPRFGFDWTPEGKILSIRREAPAAKAGLHVGDILESFDGVKLPAFLERQIRYEEGQKVSVVASRNGKSKNFVLRTQLLCPE